MSWINFIRRTDVVNSIFHRIGKVCSFFNYNCIRLVHWLKNKMSKAEKQEQMTAYRTCCALAAKKVDKEANASLEIKEGSEEYEILKKIGKYRGIGSYADFVINQIQEDEVKDEDKSRLEEDIEKKRQIEKILCDVFQVIYADYHISYKEKYFFHFLCIRLGILNGQTRAALYEYCEKKAMLKNLQDFNRYIENEIKKIIGKGKELEKQEKKYPSEYNLEKDLSVFDEKIERLYNRISELIKAIDKNKDFKIYIPIENIDLKSIYEKIISSYIISWATENKNRKKGYEDLKTLYKEWDCEGDSLLKKLNDHFETAIDKIKLVTYNGKELKYISINSLGDYRDYIKAIVKIERDTDDVAQVELERQGEINKSHGKDLARYVDFMARNKLSISERKDLIFDLFKVILADGKIEEKEDLLFKICAIILNISGEEYREIKNVLFEFQAKNDGNTKEYNEGRQYVGKKINKILKSDKVFLKNKQARFSLVCSMAFVDGELRTREKVELYDIGLRDYTLSERQINEIISNLENKKVRNQYFTEMLVNVPRDTKEKLKDLRNCMRIICSDDEITDAERNAFEMVCVFYGVDKAFFSDLKYLNKETKSIPDKYLKEIDDEKRVIISREAYEKIEHILKNKQVQGPLCGGISYALDKRYNEHCRSMARSDRKTTKYAFVIFSISALLLLVLINHHGVGTFKKGKYHHELQEYKRYKKDLTYYNAAVDYISDSLKTKAKDSVARAVAIDYIISVDSNFKTQKHEDRIQKIYEYIVKRGGNGNPYRKAFNETNNIIGYDCNYDNIEDEIDSVIDKTNENKDSISLYYIKEHYKYSTILKGKDDTAFNQVLIKNLYDFLVRDSTMSRYKDNAGTIVQILGLGDTVLHSKQICRSIDAAVSDIEKNSGHSVYCREQAIRHIKKSINEKGNLFLSKVREHQNFSGEDPLWKNCVEAFEESRYLDSTGEFIMWIENGAAYIFDECHKWLSNFKNLGWLIFITVVCVFIPTLRLRFARILGKHNLYAISVLLIVLLAVSGELRTSVLLLSTMLSIEWLILMREKEAHGDNAKEESKKSHSSLLAILVIMAILADISFGMIELEQLYSLKNVSDKVFSALFLGCICFFVGKFMEMQYMHNEEDKKVMREKLDEISEYVNAEIQETMAGQAKELAISCSLCRK